jgi:hypothetical protein
VVTMTLAMRPALTPGPYSPLMASTLHGLLRGDEEAGMIPDTGRRLAMGPGR